VDAFGLPDWHRISAHLLFARHPGEGRDDDELLLRFDANQYGL
jgi:hypothetical protein